MITTTFAGTVDTVDVGILLGPFWIFRKFAEIFANECIIIGVNDTGDKLFSGVNDTGEKIIAGDNDTGDKFIVGDKNKDAMEVGSCQGKEKVEGDKSAISPAATAADGVIVSIITPNILIRGPRGRQN